MQDGSTEPADVFSDVRQLSDEELFGTLWRAGDLEWLLLPHQKRLYTHYREWELRDPLKQPGRFPLIYMCDWGKRVGKTSMRFLVRAEDCLRTPKRSYRFVTRYQKDIEEIVDDVASRLLETCPADIRPVYRGRKGAQSAGFYFPTTGSVLKPFFQVFPSLPRGRRHMGSEY